MLVIEGVRDWDHPLVKPAVARFVAPDQQYRHATRVKRIEHSQGLAPALNPQFPHMGMTRPFDPAGKGERQIGSPLFQNADMSANADLLGIGEVIPPRAELVGIFNRPFHLVNNILFREYFKGQGRG